MILRRLGNKSQIAGEIQKYFPQHSIYIEPFFGAGGMFFNKPKANCNIMNDIDSDVYNLFQVLIDKKEELKEAFSIIPKHQDLLEYWKANKETEPIRKALRLLFLSNYTYMGKQDTLKLNSRNDVKCLENNINTTNEMLSQVQFANMDFRKFIKSISIEEDEKEKTFIYCDPPYINQTHTYEQGFTEQDTKDLFEILVNSGIKFAISEFDNDFVIGLANDYKLNIITIGERQNMKNRRTEILVTNYKKPLSLFDGV